MMKRIQDPGHRDNWKNITILTPVLGFCLLGLALLGHEMSERASPQNQQVLPHVVWPILVGVVLFATHITYLYRAGRLLTSGGKTAVQMLGPRKTQLLLVVAAISFIAFGILRDRYPFAWAWLMAAGLTYLVLGLSLELAVNVLRVNGFLRPRALRGDPGAGDKDAPPG
jgi:hypothetical protein